MRIVSGFIFAAAVMAGLGSSRLLAGDATSPKESSKATTQPAATQPAATRPSAGHPASKDPAAGITDKDIEKIDFDELPDDSGLVTPVAKDLDNLDDESRKRLTDWATKLNDWAGAKEEDVNQRVRNLMSVCSLGDIAHAEFEGELTYVVFEKLKSEVDKDQLIKATALIVLKPKEGKCPTKVTELGWDDDLDEDMIRERSAMFAEKLLGRMLGKLPKKD